MGFNIQQYGLAFAKKNKKNYSCGAWSNVAGDSVDLQAQLTSLLNAISDFEQKMADVEKRIKANEKVSYGGVYDFRKEMEKKSLYDERNKIQSFFNYGEAKNISLPKLQQALAERKQYEINEIAAEKKRLEDLAEANKKEAELKKQALDDAAKAAQDLIDAKNKELDIKKEVDVKLAEKGIDPESARIEKKAAGEAVIVAAKIKAEADSKVAELTGAASIKRKNYLIIGGILVAVVGSFLFFRNKSNN